MYASLKRYYYQQQERNIHALKYSIAFAIGYLTIFIFGNPYSVAWVLVTIAVIMAAQPVIGQQVLKSLMRLLCTVVGALLGILTFYLPSHPIMLFVMIIL